jgi:hypothetical protein
VSAFRFLPERDQRQRRTLSRRRAIAFRQPGQPVLIGNLGVLIDLVEAVLELLLFRLRKRSRRSSKNNAGTQKITHGRSIPALAPEALGPYSRTPETRQH